MRFEKTRAFDTCFHRLPLFVQEHSGEVSRYVQILAEQVRQYKMQGRFADAILPENDAVGLFGLYHDLGKIGIENTVWESSDPLSPIERQLMRTHTIIGAHILTERLPPPDLNSSQTDIWTMMSQCCLYHHERWDGRGYPFGLSGKNIPFMARVVGVADAFDAMTAERPYHRGIPKAEALQELQRGAGKQFDPELTEIFCFIMQEHNMVG